MGSYLQRSEKEVLRVAVATWLATSPHQRCHRPTQMCVWGGAKNDMIHFEIQVHIEAQIRFLLPRSSSVRAIQTRCVLTRRSTSCA